MSKLMTTTAALAMAATTATADMTPDKGFIIGYTYHENLDFETDEGFKVHGVGLAWDLASGAEVAVSAYDTSFKGDALGYTVAYTTAPLVEMNQLSLHGIAQVNYYPEMPTDTLEDTNGFFGSAGVSFRYEPSEVGVFLNVYPMPDLLGYDLAGFDVLYVAGVSYAF